jgi:hypothetical protein
VKEVQNELFEEEEEDVEEKETVDEELFPEDHAGYQEPRVVAINRPDLNMHYKFKNNYVSTTKYNVRLSLHTLTLCSSGLTQHAHGSCTHAHMHVCRCSRVRLLAAQFWNFIPKNLFEQFRRVANVYFLIIAIVTLTPPSPVKPGAFLLALVIVLGATAIKEAVEDWVMLSPAFKRLMHGKLITLLPVCACGAIIQKRYQSDRRVNSRLCEVLRRKEDGGTDKWEYVHEQHLHPQCPR